MQRNKATLIRAGLVLAGVWAVVWGVRAAADTRRASAEGLREAIAAAGFEDWSEQRGAPDPARAEVRERELRRIATTINELDFHEREKVRDQRLGEEFFLSLSGDEKALFIDLTVGESMNRFMEALDAMPEDERRRFVKRGLEEIAAGRTGEDLRRGRELGGDLLDKIAREGLRAFYEKAGTDTKLDLAPLMEAMNEMMQGLRGDELGPPRR